ncbi:MAG: 4Fe-4S dicluster domain-containing protein [Planctomycetota bacterium]
MPKKVWSAPDDLTRKAGASSRHGNEFEPEVATAIADLRARGGLDAPACPADADRQRDELRFQLPGVNRRNFLQLTGAAAVYAVVAGCNEQHPDTLVPYAQQPEGMTLGQGVWYSTAVRVNGRTRPVMAKSYDGRPIKLDGNPDHPLAKGKSDAQTQAVLLDLYDPDRGGLDLAQPGVYHDGPHQREGSAWKSVSWSVLDQTAGERLKRAGKILLITGPVDGPAQRAYLDDLNAVLGRRMVHVAYHPFAESAAVQARQYVFASDSKPTYRLDRARILVALGSDFLGGGTTGIVEQVQYGAFRRGVDGEPGQVICFEPTMSQLGTCADVRVRISPEQAAWVGWGIAAQVAQELGVTLPSAVAAALPGQLAIFESKLRPVRSAHGEVSPLRFAAERLLAAKKLGSHSLVYVGGAAQCHNSELHRVATWLNVILGNEGQTLIPAPVTEHGPDVLLAHLEKSDEFDVVIIAGANPAFDAPRVVELLAKKAFIISLNTRRDETTRLAHWHAPGLHDLESWGDSASAPGVIELQQPVVQPLWDARAAEESLAAFTIAALGDANAAALRCERVAVPATGGPVSVVSRKQLWTAATHGVRSWRSYVQQHWTTVVAPASGAAASGDRFWSAALSRGFIELSTPAAPTTNLRGDIAAPPGLTVPNGMQLVMNAARSIGDGSQLNNAWLQELPDPVSKVCWDGYAAVSPADATTQSIATNDVVEITAGSERIRLPAFVQDGQQPGTVEVFLGWGRTAAGAVAGITAADGHQANVYQFAHGVRWGAPVSIAKTGKTYELAMTQHHNRLDGSDVALDDVLEMHRVDPGAAKRSHRAEAWEAGTDGKVGGRLSVWRKHQTYPGHRWGMAIDMDLCTGCGACMVACSAENNVPVVGRDEVRKKREMHWLRIDRYYTAPAGEADARLDVEILHQPMLCQQCDNAPCEAVCPANATMKSDEGVNLQVYNRCIGTRYCSNNCPYKVRRFNWYQYSAFRAGPQGSSDPLNRVVKNALTEAAVIGGAELAHQPLQLLLNPEVTVRHRGVMEKCNFCIQRQRSWRDQERTKGTRLPDGTLTSACAQACPTAAIVWGDLNDPASAVVKTSADPRTYLVLDAESNTRPKIAYQRRLRNRPATKEELGSLDHAGAEGRGRHTIGEADAATGARAKPSGLESRQSQGVGLDGRRGEAPELNAGHK